MADTHLVKIMPSAVRDLRAIAKYIRRHSPQNAASVCEQLLREIDGLGFMPQRFKQVGRSRKRKCSVHAVHVRPYIIYYRVETDAVIVFNVRHGARRQPRHFD